MNAYIKLILVAPSILELMGTIMLANSLKIISGSPDVFGAIVRELADFVDIKSFALIERRSAKLWWWGWSFLIAGFFTQAVLTFLGLRSPPG